MSNSVQLNSCISCSICKKSIRPFLSFSLVKSGSQVRCIVTKKTKDKPRSFFDNIDKWAKEQGASGLAYFTFEEDGELSAKGPIGKFFSKEALVEIMKKTNSEGCAWPETKKT